MSKETELMKRIEELSSMFSKVSAQMSAINKYLDDAGFPKLKPTHRRVKAFSLLVQTERLEHKYIVEMNSLNNSPENNGVDENGQ